MQFSISTYGFFFGGGLAALQLNIMNTTTTMNNTTKMHICLTLIRGEASGPSRLKHEKKDLNMQHGEYMYCQLQFPDNVIYFIYCLCATISSEFDYFSRYHFHYSHHIQVEHLHSRTVCVKPSLSPLALLPFSLCCCSVFSLFCLTL